MGGARSGGGAWAEPGPPHPHPRPPRSVSERVLAGAMATDTRGKAATLALRRRLLRYRDGDAMGGAAHKARTSGASLQAPAPAASHDLSLFRRLWSLRPRRAQPVSAVLSRASPAASYPFPQPGSWEDLAQWWPALRTWARLGSDPGRG